MEKNNPNLIHNFDDNSNNSAGTGTFIIILIIAVILGIFTGFMLTKFKGLSVSPSNSTKTEKVKSSVGISDKKTFKDNAEGILREGGIDGEGNFHLERKPGDKSQNAYLTSSTVELSQFVGKKVRVWGETFKGQKAGWLMDVGLVEILQ